MKLNISSPVSFFLKSIFVLWGHTQQCLEGTPSSVRGGAGCSLVTVQIFLRWGNTIFPEYSSLVHKRIFFLLLWKLFFFLNNSIFWPHLTWPSKADQSFGGSLCSFTCFPSIACLKRFSHWLGIGIIIINWFSFWLYLSFTVSGMLMYAYLFEPYYNPVPRYSNLSYFLFVWSKKW